MSDGRQQESVAARRKTALALGGGAVALGAVLMFSFAVPNLGDAGVRNTIRLSLAWYALALWLMLRFTPADWRAATPRGRVARWCWTWGAVAFLVHVAMAFHYFHQWSHAHAFAHTRDASGFGEGLYFSYLFTALWAADVAWWWLAPAAYASRPTWLHVALHAFMLFMVFNGAVVFETGAIRWAALVALVILAIAWFSQRQRRSPAS